MTIKIIQVENKNAQVIGNYNDFDHVLLQFVDAEVPEHLKLFENGPFGVIRADEIGMARVNPTTAGLPLFGG